ncbi:MAG: M67 family metallopeptidase [Rubrobacteridae bacterium]|nr:M67 family metallopeptidase [Rubrobacteridae bacterium]
MVDERLRLTVTKSLYDEMLDYSQFRAPEEACGILAGKDYLVERVIPITNKSEKRDRHYWMDESEMFSAFKSMRNDALDLIGIFHSHPATEAYPSATDCKLAFYPEAAYVIVSLKEEPVVKAFRILGGEIENIDLLVV